LASLNTNVKEIRTVSLPLCFLCGSTGKLLYSNLKDRLFGSPGEWSMVSCTNVRCNMSWLNPAPAPTDVPLLYATYYTHGQGSPKRRVSTGLRSFFYQGYLMASYIPSWVLGLNGARCRIRRMFLHDVKPGRLLDIGCGEGTFLWRMHRLGWSATGIDLDAKAIKNANARYRGLGIDFLPTDLLNARFPDHSFDAITMNHVIEHVLDPVELLVGSRRLLKPGGRLVVTTPNIQSYGHRKFQECWCGLDPPRHLQIFSTAALQHCARKAGFESIKVATSAANADSLIGASFGIRETNNNDTSCYGTRIHFNFIRGIRSLLLQYRESLLLRRDSDCGEEAVLICHN
jgi:SAM-dependent methyltransferase